MKPGRYARFFLLLTLLASSLPGAGCAMLGLAAVGPALGVLAVVGDRSVTRTLAADRETAWAATLDALARSGIDVGETGRTGEPWVVEGGAKMIRLRAELTELTPKLTRISLNVESGGFLADSRTAEEILSQVARSLAGAPHAVVRPVTSGESDHAARLAALEWEIRRLRAKLETRQTSRGSPREPPTTSETVPSGSSPVLVIPASQGVPTLSVPQAAAVSLGRQAPVLNGGESFMAAAPPVMRGARLDDLLPATLSPAEALVPLPALTTGAPPGQ